MFVLKLLAVLYISLNQPGVDGFNKTQSSSFFYKSVFVQLTKVNGTLLCKIASSSAERMRFLQENSPSKITRLNLTEMGQLLQLCPHSEAQQKHYIRRRWASIFRGIYPGTNWCGMGHRANGLGRHASTDACCQTHDMCPEYIAPFSSKRGITNWLPYYKYSCDCDLEFYDCLKYSADEIGTKVGQWYFNIFQRHCFKEDTERVCAHKGVWFGCDRRGYVRKYKCFSNPRY